MNEKQFNIICKKLDSLISMIATQNPEDRDTKILVLKKKGLTSREIGDLFGVTEGRIRQSKGWKGK